MGGLGRGGGGQPDKSFKSLFFFNLALKLGTYTKRCLSSWCNGFHAICKDLGLSHTYNQWSFRL